MDKIRDIILWNFFKKLAGAPTDWIAHTRTYRYTQYTCPHDNIKRLHFYLSATMHHVHDKLNWLSPSNAQVTHNPIHVYSMWENMQFEMNSPPMDGSQIPKCCVHISPHNKVLVIDLYRTIQECENDINISTNSHFKMSKLNHRDSDCTVWDY